MKHVKRSIEIIRVFGIHEFALRVRTRILPPKPLSIADAAQAGMSVARNAFEVASILSGESGLESLDESTHSSFSKEWDALVHSLDLEGESKFPPEYDVEVQTARTLYVLVRWRQPDVILETGIARGLSSFALLSAAEMNGRGLVYSCDVDPESGGFVPDSLKHRWKKRIFSAKNAQAAFEDLLKDVGDIDFFFHDSNHREDWMRFEFAAVMPRMSGGGILGADDVDLNRAFLDVMPHARAAVVLLDSRKASAFAIVERTGN